MDILGFLRRPLGEELEKKEQSVKIEEEQCFGKQKRSKIIISFNREK